MGKSSSPPPAPDYAAQATAQGAANAEAARISGRMSNPNINSPYGNQTVAWGDNDQPTINQTLNPESQRIFDAQQASRLGLANLSNDALQRVQGVLSTPFQYQGNALQTSLGPAGDVSTGPSADQFLAGGGPNAAQFLAGGGPSGDQFGSAGGGPNAAQFLAGGGPSGDQFGSAGGGPSGGQFGLAGANVERGPINSGPQTGQYGYAQQRVAGPNLQGQLNTSGVANMPVNAGTTGQDAIMARLQPQINQSNAATTSRLANQGIVQGSEAYDNAMRVQNQGNNDLLSQAALQGIGLDMSANQQGYGQALQSGQFANQSALSGFDARLQGADLYNRGMAQNYGQAISTQQAQNQAQNQHFNQGFNVQNLQNQAINQNFGQAQSATQLQNQAINQNFGQAQSAQQMQNQALGQNFGQAQSATQLQNQAMGQNFGQAQSAQQMQNQALGQNFGQAQSATQLQNQAMGQNFGQRQSASQLQNQAQNQLYNQGLQSAQFGNTAQAQDLQQQLAQRNLPLNEISALMSGSQIQNPQFMGYNGQQVQPAPVFNAAQQQYNAQMQGYGNQVARNNAFNSGLVTLGSAAIGAFSDRRLKSNIVRIGEHPLDIGIYEYDIFGNRDVGVMADEVLSVKPEAVLMHPSGYLMVDYGSL